MNFILKIICGLSIILIGACATITIDNSRIEQLSRVRPAIVKLLYNHGICTAFHIGNHKFVTANHCVLHGRKLDIIELVDHLGKKHNARLIRAFPETDLAILDSPSFYGPKLEIWNDEVDGKLVPGTEIITIGYPGYTEHKYTFEIGYVKSLDFYDNEHNRFISSRGNIFRGQSGGPTISTTNGKVIGVNDMLSERIDRLDLFTHQHASISLYIPYDILAKAISDN